MSAPARSLYDEDFVRWSEDQAAAIRHAAASGANLPLDWDNLAEEIESLGKSPGLQAKRSRSGDKTPCAGCLQAAIT